VLTEAGLLPGALQKNAGLKFVCAPAQLRVETTNSVLTRAADKGAVLSIPINHFEGNYTCDAETLAQLRDEDRIVLRYVVNPNGSVDDIAGVCNEGRNGQPEEDLQVPLPEMQTHPRVRIDGLKEVPE
jgi:phosphoribosylformylglycinamidine synthase